MAFGILTTLGALGFTSNGIVTGSYAAGMMSAAASSSGGGVKSKSFVAYLQSIGASGLGAPATATLVTVGFAFAGAVAMSWGLPYGVLTAAVMLVAAVVP